MIVSKVGAWVVYMPSDSMMFVHEEIVWTLVDGHSKEISFFLKRLVSNLRELFIIAFKKVNITSISHRVVVWNLILFSHSNIGVPLTLAWSSPVSSRRNDQFWLKLYSIWSWICWHGFLPTLRYRHPDYLCLFGACSFVH